MKKYPEVSKPTKDVDMQIEDKNGVGHNNKDNNGLKKHINTFIEKDPMANPELDVDMKFNQV